jgi:hypothetical protein
VVKALNSEKSPDLDEYSGFLQSVL